uniref:Splicing factor 45 n=1 Tax=Corethrella appendiculata TaxID=1370023 RepID=U5EYX1_9DIPT
MALYDDLDTKQESDKVSAWSSGIKLLQSQLAIKQKAVIQPAKNQIRKPSNILAPVINLKSKQESSSDTDIFSSSNDSKQLKPGAQVKSPFNSSSNNNNSHRGEYDWDVVDEYDPLFPNDYDKLIKERREKDKDKQLPRSGMDRKKEDRKRGRNSNNNNNNSNHKQQFSGFGGRPNIDEEDDFRPSMGGGSGNQKGAMVAPPMSLQESGGNDSNSYDGSSVAAKIMAKYGFKDGQGLGKQEQGMSIALQVEKTSKRGGRIIHEKELMAPPPSMPSPPRPGTGNTPTSSAATMLPGSPTITEIMKSPSKVVLLRNMVGPGDVDDELEPEVKDECNTKYGEVISVIIHELQNVVPEEAVRIFVEFRRIESAIKAVVDLNGRFFGGRQVKAGFFDQEKFLNLQLLD